MSKTQQALRRYRIILKVLSKPGKHASKDINLTCINSGIDISYRTTQKDLEDLRDDTTIFGRDLGIIEDKKTKKWYSNNIPKEIFTSLELEDGEIAALLFYTKTINQYSNYPIFREITKAMKKVFESSNISKNFQDLFDSENWIETELHERIKGIELIPSILDAIRQNKMLEIEYQKFEDNQPKKHILKPILLKEDKQLWYILGINIRHESLTTYALDRIISLRMSDDEFLPLTFNSKEYFKYSFGITVSDENPVEVIISFSPKQANYLKALRLHPTQKIIKDNSRKFIISVTVKPSYEFFSKILSYGNKATIISPSDIRSHFLKIFHQAIENYK
jgi:predicted DNA-binding transcriptional regulator YafY